MTGSTHGNEQKNANALANTVIQITDRISSLRNILDDEQTNTLKKNYQLVTQELQLMQTRLGTLEAQRNMQMSDNDGKAKQISNFETLNTTLTESIFSNLESISKLIDIKRPESLSDNITAIAFINNVCDRISAEKKPCHDPEHYIELQKIVMAAEELLNKENAPAMETLEAIGKLSNPLTKALDAFASFLQFLKLINQNQTVIAGWSDFIDCHQTWYRSAPTIEEYIKNRTILLNNIEASKTTTAENLASIQLHTTNMQQLNAVSTTLREIESTLINHDAKKMALTTYMANNEIEIAELAEKTTNLSAKYEQKILEEKALKTKMQEINASGNQILDDLITFLSSQLGTDINFGGLQHTENVAAQTSNADKLETIKQALEKLPDDQELLALVNSINQYYDNTAMSEKFANYLTAKTHASKQLTTGLLANDRLLVRTLGRKSLVSEFALKLTNASEHVSNDDFISLLKPLLDTFQRSGDKTPVLDLINKHISTFPGKNFQAILNKIIIDLIDFDKKIPANFTDESLPDENLMELHTNALAVLAKLEHTQYVEKTNGLYEQITIMRNHGTMLKEIDEPCGDSVCRLADKLQTDLDHFVSAHENSLPDETAYANFSRDFSARLHSQDDEMSKHRAVWKPVMANILIGVFTLGIAIGIKLACSKISTGRASFFFEETARNQKIQSVDESLQILTTPSA